MRGTLPQLVFDEIYEFCKVEKIPFRGKHSTVLHQMEQLKEGESFLVRKNSKAIKNAIANWGLDRTGISLIKENEYYTRVWRK